MTLFEVLLVICMVVLLIAILLPTLARPQRRASRINCVINLKEAYLAAKIWSGDNGDKYPMEVSVTNGGSMELAETGIASVTFQVMSNELSSPKILVCPEDKKHVAATNFDAGFSGANISYFFSLDADESDPQTVVFGDDNLQTNGMPVHPGVLNLSTNAVVEWTTERLGRYHGPGNIALADGSVLQTAITMTNSGPGTIRWVIP